MRSFAPTCFYLRRCPGKRVYTYWNYRLTVHGVVIASSRRAAKCAVIRPHSDAIFYR